MPDALPPNLRQLLPQNDTSTAWIASAWDTLESQPDGRELFGRVLAEAIPYTGNIHARVVDLTPGHAQVQMADRPELRNHLHSLHAVALCNLAELTGNLALAYSMPRDARFIVKCISVSYRKKARGLITASCSCPVPSSAERREYNVRVELRDEAQDEVAAVTLVTLVGPVKAKATTGP